MTTTTTKSSKSFNYNNRTMTEAQANFVLALCNRISGRADHNLSDCTDIHGWKGYEIRNGIIGAEASRVIDLLKKRAAK